jgi:hypothetical protein
MTQQRQLTKEQVESAAVQITKTIELIETTISLKRQKRKGIALNVKAEIGLIDIEIATLETQLEQMKQVEAQNNENAKGAMSESSLITAPFGRVIK